MRLSLACYWRSPCFSRLCDKLQSEGPSQHASILIVIQTIGERMHRESIRSRRHCCGAVRKAGHIAYIICGIGEGIRMCAYIITKGAFVAQEGADDGSLGDRPFKILNAGLALTSFVHLLVFVPLLGGDHAGPLLPALLGVWGTSFAVSASGAYRGSD